MGTGIGGGNNFMSARGTADFLTRATTVLAIAFLYVNPLSNDCRIWKKNQFNSDEVSQEIIEDNKNKDKGPAVPTD